MRAAGIAERSARAREKTVALHGGNVMLRWIILVCLAQTPTLVVAQGPAEGLKGSRVATTQELEDVITEAKRLSDKNAFVNITARAAAVISLSDPARAETMFLDLWKFSNAPTDKNFDAQRARVHILKYLHSRNSKLARRLIAERLSEDGSSNPARTVGFDEESQLPGKLAAALLDTDPSAAAAVLEQNLATAVTMQGVAALARLREKNFLLGDYIAAKVIDAMITRPTLASLPGLHILGAYTFAGAEAPVTSIEAEYSRQSLQHRYFVTGVDVLRLSLNESNEALLKDQQLTQRHLQFRAAYQAELATILAALASRFQPSLAPELSGIAIKLAPQVPAHMPRLTQTTLARLSGSFTSEDPEQRFVFALSSGDFDTARSELERIRDGERRNMYAQVLIKSEVRALLAKSDLMEAVTAIRKVEDRTDRLAMYLDALKTTKKKSDGDVAKIIINEARLLIPQTDRNGLHLRALLAFTSQLIKLGAQDEAFEFLTGAVTTINSLSANSNNQAAGKSLVESAMSELNDPNSLLDDADMEQAFTAVGVFDLDVGLTHAKKIHPRPVQLIARLQTIQGVIKQAAAKPKPSAPPVKAAPRVNSSKP
jgi:hypothetical protein